MSFFLAPETEKLATVPEYAFSISFKGFIPSTPNDGADFLEANKFSLVLLVQVRQWFSHRLSCVGQIFGADKKPMNKLLGQIFV